MPGLKVTPEWRFLPRPKARNREPPNKLIWHSLTIQRHYKSGGEWKNTSNFRLKDIKDIITALEKVHPVRNVGFAAAFTRS
jgi:hypothetical protein